MRNTKRQEPDSEGRTKKRKIIHKIHILCCQFIHFLWDLVYVKVKSQKVGISVSPPASSSNWFQKEAR